MSTRFAITCPAVVYGSTTRSAPASTSFRSASVPEARATIVRSGRAERAERTTYRLSASESEAATRPFARSRPALRRFSSLVASPSSRSAPSSCADATASWWKSSTRYGTSDARNSSATRRPTRP